MARIGIIGSGPAGMIAALALHRAGHDITIVGPEARGPDIRSTAIMAPGLLFLAGLGFSDVLEAETAPLQTMRIMDGTRRLLRAPVVTFHASEIGENAFGRNVPNVLLNRILSDAINQHGIDWIKAEATAISETGAGVRISLGEAASLQVEGVIGADGMNSLCRAAAAIETRVTDLPQSAVVGQFNHGRHHGFVSNEFHTETGPFTTVPLKGGRASSFVWVVTPQEAARLKALPPQEMSAAMEARMESLLGAVELDASVPVQAWPLSGVLASKAASGRIALIGEAAHRFPPIGAQGLNLTLRDIDELHGALGENSSVVTAFEVFARRRASDILLRHTAVMALNRSAACASGAKHRPCHARSRAGLARFHDA
jgi:2-octaprenyl-6-methoxyphenol hydroxylase